MLTPSSHKHTARRAVHMAEDEVNIGVVSRPNVNPSYRFDFILAVVHAFGFDAMVLLLSILLSLCTTHTSVLYCLILEKDKSCGMCSNQEEKIQSKNHPHKTRAARATNARTLQLLG